MSSKRYTEEFKIEAVQQIVDRGYSVAETAKRLGTTTHSLYAWKRQYGPDAPEHQAKTEHDQEIKQLKKELRRVTKKRDILKRPRCTSPTSPSEVHLYPGPSSAVVGTTAVQDAASPPQRFQCLAAATEVKALAYQ